MNVAFLGLGAIGRPMAARVALANLPLVVWNRTHAKATDFAAANKVRAAATPREAAKGAAIVVTCLSTSSDVESLLDGPDGLLAGFDAGAILLDCTSGDPAVSRQISARLAGRSVSFLDAPVSGGVAGAEKGILTIMVGGDAAVLERAMPVLRTFGEKIVHAGPVGCGDALKAVNQGLLALTIWATGEGLAALVKAGVDPKVALDVINASSGRSNASMNLFPERVLNRAFPRTFRLALLDKDARIAAQLARDTHTPAPLLQLTSDLMSMAHVELGEAADHVEAVKVIERLAGTEIA